MIPIKYGGPIQLQSYTYYTHFIDQDIPFTHFMLFTDVVYSITAFSSLCHIFTECNLVNTTIRITILSAGIGNDIFGWGQ